MRGFMAIVLVVLVAGTAWWAIATISAVGGFQMSGHGWAALVLGLVFTIALGAGLMGLAFHSSRSGHDEPPTIDRGDA